jgi:group I intron endonuclease
MTALEITKVYGRIYVITNKVNGKKYVGQTTQKLGRRWRQHCGKGENCRVISSAIKKYGTQNFTIGEICSASTPDDLNYKELHWVQRLDSLVPNGYNLKEGGNGGGKATSQAKKRMRDSHLGKKQSAETIEKRIAPLRGKSRPAHVIQAMRNGKQKWLANGVPIETRVKQSLAHIGKTLPLEVRRKMCGAQTERRREELTSGTGPVFSDATRAKMRLAKLGKEPLRSVLGRFVGRKKLKKQIEGGANPELRVVS